MINKDNSISSKILLSCKRAGAQTLLDDSLFDIPYKVVHYGSKLLHSHLEVMLMCYSPGVMDGDSLDMQINCEDNTEMKVFTQSFHKLHPMVKGATQVTTANVGHGATLQYLPQPIIPFRKALFHAENNIHLKEDSHLIWGDIISGGRIQSNERFEFTRIHMQTKVYRENKLVFYDNLLMHPSKQPIQSALFFQGFTHQGTLLIVSPYAKAFKKELDDIITEQFKDMHYGYTECGKDALLVRALGESGDAMHTWLGNLGEMCWSFIQHKKQQEKPLAKLVKLPAAAKPKLPATKPKLPAAKTTLPAEKPKAPKKRVNHA